MFEKQWLHALGLFLLLSALFSIEDLQSVKTGELWGRSARFWFWTAALIAVAHQVYVWFCWRAQLHAGLITRLLGEKGFGVYAAGFAMLGISRVLAVFALAIANRDTVPLDPALLKAAAIVALVPALYLFYSVKRYFTFTRALGIDHFDPAWRSAPFVRQGIFRFTRNGMYVYGFLMMWVPGLWWGSAAALAVALFNHLYIWVHYHATELPDMARIYGAARATGKSG
jgi:protein-S-isoprenylcysteine O-methyltransferase Ste14